MLAAVAAVAAASDLPLPSRSRVTADEGGGTASADESADENVDEEDVDETVGTGVGANRTPVPERGMRESS